MIQSNRQFIGCHAARQAANEVAIRCDSDLKQVEVARFYLAQICGLTEEQIVQLAPKTWRRDREFRELGGIVFYVEPALLDLVGVFSTSGHLSAAQRLMKWLTGSAAAEPARDVKEVTSQGGAASPEKAPWYQHEAGGMA